MVESIPDAETELLKRVRAIAGYDIPVAVTFDFHANIGAELLEHATIVTTYDTYPHTDAGERAQEASRCCGVPCSVRSHPTMALVKPPLLLVPQEMPTDSGPFRDVFARAHALEASGEALTITIAGGFAYSDVPMAGVSVLVTTDGDAPRAEAIARDLATELWERRAEMTFINRSPEEAVRQAIAFPEGPVILVDVGDNIGGGHPWRWNRAAVRTDPPGRAGAVVVIADAEAAALAISAGPGGSFDAMVGGKVDALHGDPVRVSGRVRLISDGRWIHEGPENAGVPVESGPTAVVQAGGVSVVLTSTKIAPGDQQQLKSVGIWPDRQQIIVVKAAIRWKGGYEPIARHVIYVDTPGLGSTDLTRFAFQHLTRPIYPLDEEARFGEVR